MGVLPYPIKALAELQRNVLSNIYLFLNEAKRLCLNHCFWLLDDAEWC